MENQIPMSFKLGYCKARCKQLKLQSYRNSWYTSILQWIMGVGSSGTAAIPITYHPVSQILTSVA